MKIFLSLVLFLALNSAYAQNDTIMSCAMEANKKGMVYLKNFQTTLSPLNESRSGQKWSVLLNKGTKYRFYLCERNSDRPKQIILTLFDDSHPENAPYARTGKKGHFYFECNKTGSYNVSIRFKDGYGKDEVSAVGIMLFVSKTDN